jgi:hypothetical protein
MLEGWPEGLRDRLMKANRGTGAAFVDKGASGGHNKKASLEL